MYQARFFAAISLVKEPDTHNDGECNLGMNTFLAARLFIAKRLVSRF